MNPTLVIVSCADSGELHTLRLDAEGRLAPQQVLPLGGMLMPMAFSPDRRRLYVARRSEPLAVLTLAVDPADGRLELLAETPLPASMAYVSTDRSGRFLFSASYGGNQIAVQRIGADGVVQAEARVIPTAPHAHAILASPDNREVLATALGGGHLMRFAFDAATGELAPQPALVAVHEGAGPRHFVFGRDGERVYLLNELDATLVVFGRDAGSGALSALQTLPTVPEGFDGEPWAADLHLSPCGRWLYSCERRTSTIAGFAVDAASGRLSPVGHWPTQPQPRGFRISPDGRHLVASGQLSDRIDVFAIDADSGALRRCGDGPVGAGPNWIEMLELSAA